MIRRRRSWREPQPLQAADEASRSAISIRLLRVEMESKRFKEPRGFRIANRTRCTESQHGRATGSSFHINN